MMRKRFLSLTCALALCLGLLPVTALAADGIELYVGGQLITGSGCYKKNPDGKWTKVEGSDGTEPASGQFSYDAATFTLTLNEAEITNNQTVNVAEGYTYYGSVIAFSQTADVSLKIVVSQGTSTITGTGGIRVESTTGNASLSIKGPGSLEVKNVINDSGIVLIGSKNVNLGINSADVTISGVQYYGVHLAAGDKCQSTATINDGNLTVSDSVVGIYFMRLYNNDGPSSLTVSGNAMVDTEGRTGGIINGFPDSFQIGADGESGGIVFNGNSGTVYGNVTLEDDLEIASGETLTIPDDSSLNSNGKLTNNGKIIVDNGGKLEGTINGNQPPKITTERLNDGTVNTKYNQTLVASGDATITWSSSDLPNWLTLNSDGTISGTPTAAGTSTFTVKANNNYGSDSKSLSITIGAQTNVPVTGVSLNTSTLNLIEGGTGTLIATVEPNNATNRNVTWESSNTSVATVDANGLVTAVSAGTATITATADGKSATCTVTVTAATVPVTGVTMNKTSTSLYVGDTETLTATVAPDNATNRAVTWASSNPSVAKVENGVVTALACGTAVITATTQDGNHTATCAVTVRPDIPPANPNYKITVEATQGGTVTADPTAAKAGTTVTLTPVPHRGYQVGTVAVTDRFGEPVAVTEQAGGTYTFTMPNGQVTVTVTFAETPLPFTDVTEGDWFYDAVRYAYETGLMDGVGDNLFAPNSQTTRAQLVTILYRLAGEPEPGGDSGFADVETGTWYTDAVAWAAQNGIVNGVSDTEFAPGDDITREQLAAILYRYAACQGYDVSQRADLSGFGDASSISDYAQEALSWAHAQGLVLGFEDGSLRPQGTASRAQIAAVLMRFLAAVPTA